MKTASFTLRGSVEQSIRWGQVARSEGYKSVGQWAARALDAYIKLRVKSALPVPLAWRRGRFRVRLFNGRELEVSGFLSPPFASFRGTNQGLVGRGINHHSLVRLANGDIIATLAHRRNVQALAADLARLWVRWANGETEPTENPEPIIERHRREEA